MTKLNNKILLNEILKLDDLKNVKVRLNLMHYPKMSSVIGFGWSSRPKK